MRQTELEIPDNVSPTHAAKALATFKKRLQAGEDVVAILGGCRDPYIIGKILLGDGSMSYRICNAIMKWDEEDGKL